MRITRATTLPQRSAIWATQRSATWAALSVVAAATVTISAAPRDVQAAAPENHLAAQAVAAVTSSDAAPSVPRDFAAFSGYEPVIVAGHLANPNGACSSPVPLPDEFDSACKAHDLGYDLLRYAQFHGDELGPWARQALDGQLDQRMHDACDTRKSPASRSYCFAMADIATTAVNGNSWRQNYLTPVQESGFGYAAAGVLGLSALGLTFLRPRRPPAASTYSQKAVAT
ncbi:hypothetical protein [Rhodococcus sp. MS16]|uniref:hypothetical protein n=1 Tax=Rhodococcus sp. MS16 TaxID=2579941 RepID=UPI001F5BD26C|nr:hypothetical protein [Rhodococcus sp. MS16]